MTGESGQYYSGRAGAMPPGMMGEEAGVMGGMHGGGGGGGHSPRWTVGAQVAGRLEEMRARELAASLRSKVQENEAMKRYLESVKVRFNATTVVCSEAIWLVVFVDGPSTGMAGLARVASTRACVSLSFSWLLKVWVWGASRSRSTVISGWSSCWELLTCWRLQ